MKTPLRVVREKRGLTMQQVAESVAINPSNLSRIERGEQTPSKGVAERLSAFFGHEVSEIQIIYPERYTAFPDETTVPTSTCNSTQEDLREAAT